MSLPTLMTAFNLFLFLQTKEVLKEFLWSNINLIDKKGASICSITKSLHLKKKTHDGGGKIQKQDF